MELSLGSVGAGVDLASETPHMQEVLDVSPPSPSHTFLLPSPPSFTVHDAASRTDVSASPRRIIHVIVGGHGRK